MENKNRELAKTLKIEISKNTPGLLDGPLGVSEGLQNMQNRNQRPRKP